MQIFIAYIAFNIVQPVVERVDFHCLSFNIVQLVERVDFHCFSFNTVQLVERVDLTL